MVFILALSACSGNNAEELFETAQFEELQNNQEHAMQLYEEIIEKYAGSAYAQHATKRLAELRKDITNR
jgi:TolA-binding protein